MSRGSFKQQEAQPKNARTSSQNLSRKIKRKRHQSRRQEMVRMTFKQKPETSERKAAMRSRQQARTVSIASLILLTIITLSASSCSPQFEADSTTQQMAAAHVKQKQATEPVRDPIENNNNNNNDDDDDNKSRLKRESGQQQADLLPQQDNPHKPAVTQSQSQLQAASGKRTLYACEDKQLQIECSQGDSIHLIRANYGRFSIVTCNEFGHLGWSAKCSSPSSFEIIENSCQGKQACQLLASNSIFGDACPGTQKYLEVHYQCLASNGTNPASVSSLQQVHGSGSAASNAASPNQMATLSSAAASSAVNSNKQAVSLHHYPAAASSAAPMINNNFNTNTINNNNKHVMLNDQLPPTPLFPPWMPPGVRPAPQQNTLGNALPSLAHFGAPPANPAAFYPQATRTNQQQQHQTNVPDTSASPTKSASKCPEIVWRQIRWPATEAGSVARMPCPVHASSGLPLEQVGAASSFQCLPNGHWEMRVHAQHCQSAWLRNLTQRVEVGESPLAALAEMAQKTRLPANINTNSLVPANQGGLFGDDLVEIGRIVRRFVSEDLNEWLSRISDDKQRISFGRDTIQLLIELVNNLAHEQHSDAWADLSGGGVVGGSPSDLPTSRQRIAGSLVQSLESGLVIFAALLPSPPPTPGTPSSLHLKQQHSTIYSRLNENLLVSIRSIPIEMSGQQNKTIELSFPGDQNQATGSSLFGQAAGLSWWNQMDQKFDLHLQVSLGGLDKTPDSGEQQHTSGNWQNLKVVYIMTRGLSAQMDPSDLSNQHEFGDFQNQNRWFVNSNLISISLVADPAAYKSGITTTAASSPLQVALAAPFELVFKHQDIAPPGWNSRQALRPSRCVFWEPANSEWMQDGCRLVESNRTHSTCACSHLTTFALLTEWDPTANTLSENENVAVRSAAAAAAATIAQRLQLEGIENEFQLASRTNVHNNKLLYLAKMLEGHLFGGHGAPGALDQHQVPAVVVAQHQQNQPTIIQARYLVLLSCVAGALLLALAIAASLHDRAHTSRLLASIPLRAAPSLLVTTNRLNPVAQFNVESSDAASPTTHHCHAPSSGSTASSRQATDSNNARAATANQAQIWHCQTGQAIYGGWQQKPDHAPIQNQNQSTELTYEEPLTSSSKCNSASESRQLKVPIHILCQLFLIQVLVLLMLISQNWWPSRPQIPQMLPSNQAQQQQQQQQQLDPIGQITWLLVLLFFYLILSLTCWLLVQFLQLNATLLQAGSRIKKVKSIGGNNPQLANHIAIIGSNQQSSSLDSSEHDLQSDLTTSKSTTNGGSTSNGHQQVGFQYWPGQWNDEANSQQYNKMEHAACKSRSQLLELSLFSLTHLLPVLLSAIYLWVSSYSWLVRQLNELTYVSSFASQVAAWPLLLEATSFSVTLPIYLIPSICVLLFTFALYSVHRNNAKSQWTRNSGQQHSRPAANPYGGLAHEQNPFVLAGGGGGQVALTAASAAPLVPNGSQKTATSTHSQSHSSSSMQQPANRHQHHPISSLSNDDMLIEKWRCSFGREGGSTSSSGGGANNSPKVILPNHYQCQYANQQQQPKVRLAKRTCAMLIVLLTLHSSCWLSFMAHIRQSLEKPSSQHVNNLVYVGSPNMNVNVKSNDQWSSFKMLYSFAFCNLALICLVCWSKRRHLVRASHQIGLRRALSYCHYWFCCCFCHSGSSGHSSSTPASSLMSGSKSEHHLNQNHQLGASYYETAAAPGHQTTKISPSSQSLFMISQSQQQLYGTNYIQQATYGIFNPEQQQQQHLYQPIYGGESSLALNQPEPAVLQQRNLQHLATLGHSQAAQRMQQQQHHQQQHSFTLSRPNQQQQQLMMLDANQAMKQQHQQQAFYQQQHQHQQQQQAANSRTLGGGYQRALVVKQQGEVEGPLVALGNSGASSSVGSSSGNSSADSATATNSNQRQQLAATFGPQHRQQQQPQYEHQLFNQQQSNQFVRPPNHQIQQQQSFDNNQQLHFRRQSQQQQQQQTQRQLQQQFLAARQTSSTEDETGHIYDTAQNCYASLALQ